MHHLLRTAWNSLLFALPYILAIGLLLMLGAKGISRVDTYWDSVAYHLPFASRIAGIFPRSEFIFPTTIEFLYQGFPKLAHAFQGILWRATGLVSATNLVGLLSLVILIAICSRVLAIEIWKSTLFFLSIPLVLIHGTSSYVDLPMACAVTMSFVFFLSALERRDFTYRAFVLLAAPLVIAANIKVHAVPVSLALVMIYLVLFLISSNLKNLNQPNNSPGVFGFIVLFLLFATLICLNPIRNMLIHSNPLYPYEVKFGPLVFLGPFTPPLRSNLANVAPRWVTTASPLLFLMSLSELYLFSSNPGMLWSVDMSNGGSAWNYDFFKLGGFFIANLLLWSSIIILSLRGRQRSTAINASIVIVISTGVVAVLPYAFFLRYWMFLPLMLAVAALALLRTDIAGAKSIYQVVFPIQAAILLFVLVNAAPLIIPRNLDLLPSGESHGVQLPAYKLSTDEPSCVVGGAPYGFLYKLSNEDIVFQLALNQSECFYPPIVVD